VDNRVEAPARVPGDDSEGTAPADESASSPVAEQSPAAEDSQAADHSPAAAHTPAEGEPGGSSNGAPPPPRNPAQPTFVPAPSQPNGSGPTSTMAAVAGAASGLASKVGASFSGLTKTKPNSKPRPKPKSSQVRKPGAGLPPRPQQPGRPPASGQPSRSAMLTLQRLEPMSVMKFSSLIALVGWVVVFVAVVIVYFALSKMGVFNKIEDTVGLVTSNQKHAGADAAAWFSASRVLEYTAIVCTINAVLFTALATVGAALYNLVTTLTGGVEVTLKESD